MAPLNEYQVDSAGCEEDYASVNETAAVTTRSGAFASHRPAEFHAAGASGFVSESFDGEKRLSVLLFRGTALTPFVEHIVRAARPCWAGPVRWLILLQRMTLLSAGTDCKMVVRDYRSTATAGGVRRKHCRECLAQRLVRHENRRKRHQVRARDHAACAECKRRRVTALARNLDRLIFVHAKRPRQQRGRRTDPPFEDGSRSGHLPGGELPIRLGCEPPALHLEVRMPVGVRLNREQPGVLNLGELLPRECVRGV